MKVVLTILLICISMLAIWQQLEVRQLKSDLNQTQSALREYWGLQAKQDSINQIKVKINDNHKNK